MIAASEKDPGSFEIREMKAEEIDGVSGAFLVSVGNWYLTRNEWGTWFGNYETGYISQL